MISHTASELPWMLACRPAGESRKSMKANSARRKPSSTSRALASLAVQPSPCAPNSASKVRWAHLNFSSPESLGMRFTWTLARALSATVTDSPLSSNGFMKSRSSHALASTSSQA